MITGSYYSGASSSYSIHFIPPLEPNENDVVIQQISEAIQRDPSFSCTFHTTLQCLIALRLFFNRGGNPATRIPELHIGNEIVRNISCLDFVSRLNKSAFEGLKKIDWGKEQDNWNDYVLGNLSDGELETAKDLDISIVYLFNEVFKKGFEKIDRLIGTPISTGEIVELIHCVIAGDPYCSLQNETGNRILNLVSKFLESHGSPVMRIKNIRIGTRVIDEVTVFELVYLLWNFLREQNEGKVVIWENDRSESGALSKFGGPTPNLCAKFSDDPVKNKEMSQRFVAVINDFEEVINWMLANNRLADEDFLPLIRCVVELPDVRCWFPRDNFPLKSSSSMPSSRKFISEKRGKRFLYLMTYFAKYKVKPNQIFSIIEIGANQYKDLTCFQLAYLIWKHPEAAWSEEDEKKFQSIFQDLLLDPRTDLRSRFSEHRLRYSMQHFNDKRNIHSTPPSSSSSSSASLTQVRDTFGEERISRFPFDRESYINYDCTGYHLERITIAHYAVIVNDYVTLRLVLRQEPFLITANCCMTRGKELLFSHIGHHKSKRWISSSSKNQSMMLLRDLESSGKFHGDISIRDKYPNEICPDRVTYLGGAFFKPDGETGSTRDVHHITGATPLHLTARTGHERSLANLESLGRGAFFKPDGETGSIRDVRRITGVTLLHLAARTGHEGSLATLESLGNGYVSLAAEDSDGKIPKHYLKSSIKEGIVQRDRGSSMLKDLESVTKLYRGLPQVDMIIHRKGYDLYYDTSKKVAHFVRQRLRKDSFGTAKRTSHKWRNNLNIPELNRVIDNDYKGSGYDRGHLVPAEDATHSDQTMGDTFHPENAVPQNPNMNRGVWSRLEAHVRTLAHNNDCVEVFTGPLFLPQLEARGRVITYPVIGRGDVHVPTHLFKIIFIHNRSTSTEVYIISNETWPKEIKFSDPRKSIEIIQENSGILFREWINHRR